MYFNYILTLNDYWILIEGIIDKPDYYITCTRVKIIFLYYSIKVVQ